MSQVGKPLRIAFLSDTHFVEADDFNYKQWQMALEKAKSTDPDIYLVGGDITNSGSKKKLSSFCKHQGYQQARAVCAWQPRHRQQGV